MASELPLLEVRTCLSRRAYVYHANMIRVLLFASYCPVTANLSLAFDISTAVLSFPWYDHRNVGGEVVSNTPYF